MSDFFPSWQTLGRVVEFQVDEGNEPVRWVLSVGFAAHLADLAGIDYEPGEPLEVMGVAAAAFPVDRHWELLVRTPENRMVYVRPKDVSRG